ncbi:MAG: threonine synthase [Eggerthellaceae bacterium]|jgi:threonine synthase|nr:threonine synthase [Eggerthellaceae bacterium]MDR2716273.1 threonine synthase [Coriobacteriaceae bacterium]
MTDNLYIDTRGLHRAPIPFTEAVICGLADGGGLFVPEKLPRLPLGDILALGDMPYAQRAAFVYKAFGVDMPGPTIDALMGQAYGGNFDEADICPIVSLDAQTHLLELWHGPTSAFKDMALQCLPLFFAESARRLTEQGKLDHGFMILVATSGDTGSAALEGFKDKEGIRIGVLYPHGGVSDIQFRQMVTQAGANVMVWGVDGNFDDCQTVAKAVFNDEGFARTLLEEERVALSSANSINWGRLLPQVVYYVSSYAAMVRDGAVAPGQPIDVCVPTGNFGNILAAWYAKSIGTPIDMLFCASNENRVLTDFINTGTYDISGRDFVLTPSPSMDILVSSNLERQLFELAGRDAGAVRTWMGDLRVDGAFRVDAGTFAELRQHFAADSVDSAACLAAIRQVFDTCGYLLDPHTAVAWQVAERLRGDNPVLIAATAHWAKFGANVYRALHGIEPGGALPEGASCLTDCALNALIAKESTCYNIPDGLASLDEAEIRFTEVVGSDPADVKEAVLRFLGS